MKRLDLAANALGFLTAGHTLRPNDHVSSGTGLWSPMTKPNVTNTLVHPNGDIDRVMVRRSPIPSGAMARGGILGLEMVEKDNKEGGKGRLGYTSPSQGQELHEPEFPIRLDHEMGNMSVKPIRKAYSTTAG